MTIILTFDQNLSQGIRWIKSWDHRTYPLTQPFVKIVYCLSTEDRLKKALVILSERDLEEKKALVPEDKAPSLINQVNKIQRYTWQVDDYSWDNSLCKVSYLIACEHIEVNA